MILFDQWKWPYKVSIFMNQYFSSEWGGGVGTQMYMLKESIKYFRNKAYSIKYTLHIPRGTQTPFKLSVTTTGIQIITIKSVYSQNVQNFTVDFCASWYTQFIGIKGNPVNRTLNHGYLADNVSNTVPYHTLCYTSTQI